jgi:uracil-DNA glycosylase
MNVHEAKRLAAEFLASEGSTLFVRSAKLERRFGVWVVSYIDPRAPEAMLDGGALVVTDAGDVYEVGSAPGSLEKLMDDVGVSLVDDVADAWVREGEGLALLADVDPEEAAGLAVLAASRRQRREQSEFARFERGEDLLPDSWTRQLSHEFEKEYWPELLSFVARERQNHEVYPDPSQTFAAFELTPYEGVRVVILGQDPYPTPGYAHGLAFSVPLGTPIADSLRNIHEELASDVRVTRPTHGNLEGWARQGVLLLNTTLTVRAGAESDHQVHRRWPRPRQGWRSFTDAVIAAVNEKQDRVVFILWGADARRKAGQIDQRRHRVIESVHPSPLSAYKGFFGSAPFSKTNRLLRKAGQDEIDWGRFH